MSSAKPKRPIAGVQAFMVILGLSLLVGLVAGFGSMFTNDLPGVVGFALGLAVNGFAMAAALWLCVWWWNRIDEAAREAHKWAWWWGGCTGMAIGGAFLLTLFSRQGQVDQAGLTTNEVVASGMFLMMTCQVVGYGIAWAVWWAKRR